MSATLDGNNNVKLKGLVFFFSIHVIDEIYSKQLRSLIFNVYSVCSTNANLFVDAICIIYMSSSKARDIGGVRKYWATIWQS